MFFLYIRSAANKFQRVRPYNLAEALGMKDFDHMPLDSDTMKTPAYPSGHSLQSRLVAMYYAEKYPEHKQALMMAADECGEGRIYAGWNYPSDHHAATRLAKQIYPNITISMNESVIDIPRRTYAPGVFDDEDTNNPKVKDSVLKIINAKKKFPNHVICGYDKIHNFESPKNINLPKVVVNSKDELIYISRALVPGTKKKNKNINYFKQVCIYAFNKKQLKKFHLKKRKSIIEKIEDIEILRFFDLDEKIKMVMK